MGDEVTLFTKENPEDDVLFEKMQLRTVQRS